MKRDGSHARHERDGKNPSHPSHDSQCSHEPILPQRGNYRSLLSFQKAEIIYDLTFRFAHKHLAKGDRTIDQMIQSARSGKKKPPRRQQSLDHFERNRDQADECGARQPGRAVGRLPRLPPRPRPEDLGQGVQGGAIRPKAWEQESADLRGLSRICGDPIGRSGSQHRPLPDPPSQLPHRSATPLA